MLGPPILAVAVHEIRPVAPFEDQFLSHVEHGFERKTMMSQPKLGYVHLFLLFCRKLQPWRAATKLSANFQPSIHVYSIESMPSLKWVDNPNQMELPTCTRNINNISISQESGRQKTLPGFHQH
jgi:hypothetical protein